MSLTEEYKEYFKNNPEGYWFKRKLYGWGWTPVKWQGWVAVLIYIVIVLVLAFNFDETSSDNEILFGFVLPSVLLTIGLISVCYKKGEKPRWQWGLPKK